MTGTLGGAHSCKGTDALCSSAITAAMLASNCHSHRVLRRNTSKDFQSVLTVSIFYRLHRSVLSFRQLVVQCMHACILPMRPCDASDGMIETCTATIILSNVRPVMRLYV